jgi:hypothetical protein
MQIYGGKSKMGVNKILRIETEKLIIRKFVSEDWNSEVDKEYERLKNFMLGSYVSRQHSHTA